MFEMNMKQLATILMLTTLSFSFAATRSLESGKSRFVRSAITLFNHEMPPSNVLKYAYNFTNQEDGKWLFVRGLVEEALGFYETQTCLRFLESTPDDPSAYVIQYLRASDPGCSCCSTPYWTKYGVARLSTSRPGTLMLHPKCFQSYRKHSLTTVLHEIGHGLGFRHEQNHPDAPNHILVNYSNVKSRHMGNFKPLKRDQFWIEAPYEFGSFMHYTPANFNRDKSLPTFTTINPLYQQTPGSSLRPTFMDMYNLNQAYGCHCISTPSNSPDSFGCLNGGYRNPNDCTGRCVCPPGWSGRKCSELNTEDDIDECETIQNTLSDGVCRFQADAQTENIEQFLPTQKCLSKELQTQCEYSCSGCEVKGDARCSKYPKIIRPESAWNSMNGSYPRFSSHQCTWFIEAPSNAVVEIRITKLWNLRSAYVQTQLGHSDLACNYGTYLEVNGGDDRRTTGFRFCYWDKMRLQKALIQTESNIARIHVRIELPNSFMFALEYRYRSI